MTQDTTEAPYTASAMSKYALRSPLMRLSQRKNNQAAAAAMDGRPGMAELGSLTTGTTTLEYLKADLDTRFVDDVAQGPPSPPIITTTTATAAEPLAMFNRTSSASLTVPNSPRLSRSAASSPVPEYCRSSPMSDYNCRSASPGGYLSPRSGGFHQLRRGRSFDPGPHSSVGTSLSASSTYLRREKSINTVHYTVLPPVRSESESERRGGGCRLRREKSLSPAPPPSSHRRQQFAAAGGNSPYRAKARSVSETGKSRSDDRSDRPSPARFISFREKSQVVKDNDDAMEWRLGNYITADESSKEAENTTIKETIRRNITRLEQLAQEFEHLTSELSAIVTEEHELLGQDGDESAPSSHAFPANIYRLGRLNQSAQTDIRQAYLAYRDYVGAVEEFNAVLAKEAEAVSERAGRLGTGSQRLFLKVQPQAVARLRSAGETDEDEELEDEEGVFEDRIVFYAS